MTSVLSNSLRAGDRIVVQARGVDDFEATVRTCLGWGLVHGVMEWAMVRDDGTEFTYGLPYLKPCPVSVVD